MASLEPAARPTRLVRIVPLLVLAAGAACFFGFGLHRYITFDTLAAHRASLVAWVEAHALIAPIAYVLAYVATVAFSLPGATILTLAGGFLFGMVAGAIYAVIGATMGATIVFLVARSAVPDLLRPAIDFLAARSAFVDRLRAKVGNGISRMEQGFRRSALSYLFVLRLVPLFPFFLVNLVPAFLSVPLRTYVTATFLGIIPGAVVYASVGNGLGAVFDRGGKPDLGIIFSPPILLPILGLAALALVPVVYKRWRARRIDA